jgi:hypothetical protein
LFPGTVAGTAQAGTPTADPISEEPVISFELTEIIELRHTEINRQIFLIFIFPFLMYNLIFFAFYDMI